jgi:hypothetical protein
MNAVHNKYILNILIVRCNAKKEKIPAQKKARKGKTDSTPT